MLGGTAARSWRPGTPPPSASRAGHDDAVVGQNRYPVAARRGCELRAAFWVLDRAVVLIDENHLIVEKAAGLMEDFRQFAECGEHGDPVGMVMNDDASLGVRSVEFSVNVDRWGDIPTTFDDVGLLIQPAYVRGRQLAPPKSPWG